MSGSVLELPAPFTPNERQWDALRAYAGPASQVLLDGSIRSGKTQIAARALVEDALERPSIYVVARQHYRELRDSTQRAMLEGDGALPPLIPREVRDPSYGTAGYRADDEAVRFINGAEIRFRNLENAHTWLNVTLGGIMIDQVEEMDEGPEGERLYDTLRGRLSDPRARRKMLLVANPAPMTHFIYRRLVNPATRDPRSARVHFTLRDNAANLPAEYVAEMEATKETRPYWYRTYILGEWGAFEGAAYTELADVHRHVPEEIPAGWRRIEGMDFGVRNPTAWLVASVDYDGNLIIFDEFYDRVFIEEAARAIRKRRRESWWARDDHDELVHATCYADPAIKTRWGVRDPRGKERSAESEYLEHGISFAYGQNDRKAGYARIRELLHPHPERPFPDWHPRYGELGSPRMFVSPLCKNLLEQLGAARVKSEGKDALDVVDPEWESLHGHAHAAARYLCMASISPSEPPERARDECPSDPREAAAWRRGQAVAEWDQDVEDGVYDREREVTYA